MKRSKTTIKNNMKEVEIAVFSLAKGVEDIELQKNQSYQFVQSVFDDLMTKNNVKSEKIGFGGYKNDIVKFVAGLVDFWSNIEMNIQLDLNNTEDFDPDIPLPDKNEA